MGSNPTSAIMNDTKLVGDISEEMVVVELLRLDFKVLRPVGDRLPYDVAVDLNGRLVRIQVRTAWHNADNDSYVGNVSNAKTNRKRYSFVKANTKDVEFFVFVIQDRREFYIVPSVVVEAVPSKVMLVPHRDRRQDRYSLEAYRDNWNQIAGGPVSGQGS